MNPRIHIALLTGVLAMQVIMGVALFRLRADSGSAGAPRHVIPAARCWGDGASRFCSLGMAELAGQSNVLNESRVALSGYLAIDHGTLSLYASEADYHSGLNESSLQIRTGLEAQKDLFDKYGNGYVRLSGVFDFEDPTALRARRLGALRGPIVANPLPSRKSREGWSDIRIHVDDMPGPEDSN